MRSQRRWLKKNVACTGSGAFAERAQVCPGVEHDELSSARTSTQLCCRRPRERRPPLATLPRTPRTEPPGYAWFLLLARRARLTASARWPIEEQLSCRAVYAENTRSGAAPRSDPARDPN
jgi:hypothetical protein